MDESVKRETDGREKLELALEARDLFLKENPDLQPFQDEIDRILAKTVGYENRLKALSFLIEKKLCELHDSIADLQTTVETAYDNVRKADTGVMLDEHHASTHYLH